MYLLATQPLVVCKSRFCLFGHSWCNNPGCLHLANSPTSGRREIGTRGRWTRKNFEKFQVMEVGCMVEFLLLAQRPQVRFLRFTNRRLLREWAVKSLLVDWAQQVLISGKQVVQQNGVPGNLVLDTFNWIDNWSKWQKQFKWGYFSLKKRLNLTIGKRNQFIF